MAEIQTVLRSLPNGDGVVPEEARPSAPLLIFLGSKTLLKPAKPFIDSLHRLLRLFGDCGAGRSTSSDIELVTTFSGEKNWSIVSTGLLVGMTVSCAILLASAMLIRSSLGSAHPGPLLDGHDRAAERKRALVSIRYIQASYPAARSEFCC
jgi:hypothetical protein